MVQGRSEGQHVEQIGLALCLSCRHLGCRLRFEQPIHGIRKRCLAGHGSLEERHDLLYRLGRAVWISGRIPVADQEADVADDTVTDLAEAREMDEESLLEQRGRGLSK